MTTFYVDTGALIALIWRRDRAHAAVAHAFDRLRKAGDLLITCDPVVSETATRLRYDAGLEAALRFFSIIEDGVRAGQLVVRETDAPLRRNAFAVMARYDGLRLSYADAMGAAVAREAGATTVLGLDEDFRVMGFELLPPDPRGGARPG